MVAALLDSHVDDFGKKRFCYQASFWMVSRGRRKQTTISTNELFALAFLDYSVAPQGFEHA